MAGNPKPRGPLNHRWTGWALACLAILALLGFRAARQSITLDEADSFLSYAAPDWPSHWYPASGNHPLNSMLMRVTALALGISPFTVRLPALLGAALYLAAVVRLIWLFPSSVWFRRAWFACLTLNPFVLDFLAAARGYSLAMAFLAWMSAELAAWITSPAPPAGFRRMSLRLAMLAALCFCANFSFAIVALVMVIAGWLVGAPWLIRRKGYALCVLTRSTGVLLATGFVLCGSIVWNWPPGNLTVGARRIRETLVSVIEESRWEPNAWITQPLLADLLRWTGEWLPRATLVLLAAHLAMIGVARRWTRLRASPGAVLLLTLIMTLFLHWAALAAIGLLLPKDRTALFIPFLWFAALGSLAAVESRFWLRRLSIRTGPTRLRGARPSVEHR